MYTTNATDVFRFVQHCSEPNAAILQQVIRGLFQRHTPNRQTCRRVHHSPSSDSRAHSVNGYSGILDSGSVISVAGARNQFFLLPQDRVQCLCKTVLSLPHGFPFFSVSVARFLPTHSKVPSHKMSARIAQTMQELTARVKHAFASKHAAFQLPYCEIRFTGSDLSALTAQWHH